MPEAFSNTFGCQHQSLQPPITLEITCYQTTQQYPHHRRTRQPPTIQQNYDKLPSEPTTMLAITRQPDDHHQPTILKTFRKFNPIVKLFNFDGDPEQGLNWAGVCNTTIDNTDMSDSEKLTQL